jgi:Leucine-rich repeat (LRR) protein
MGGVPYVEYALSGTNHVLAVDADTVLIGMDELPIDAAHFPDADFRAYVAASFDDYGNGNGNGWLSGAEIAAVESISMDSFAELQSVQGIEYFTELTSLELTGNPNLTAVDLSANTKLTYLDLGGNSLTSLDLTGLTGLTKVYVSENQLHFLDVSGIQSLSVLSVDDNPMGAFILGDQPELKTLNCYGTGGALKTLDLRGCPYLLDAYLNGTKTEPEWGVAYSSPQGNLQLDAGTEVLTPGCISVDVTHFPDTNFREYITQNVDTNLTQWLTPEEIAAVTVIDVQNLGIASMVGIEYFPALESLTTLGNPIRSLDLSGNPNLRQLHCSSCELSELDLSHTPDLYRLSCLGNSITSLDLTHTPRLVEAVEEGTREEYTDEGYDGWFYRKEPCRLLVDKGVELIGAVWQPDYDGVLPAAMKTLEEEALAGCAFRAVRIPEGAVKIGSRAFAGSPNLEYVYIPESVTEIAADAFDGVPACLTIIGAAGSAAESYAAEHGFVFAAA